MSRVFLAFGANLGQPLEAFRQARQQLAEHPQIEIIATSPLYRTTAVGGPAGQPDYLNAVLQLETCLSPQHLLELCQALEEQAGRNRTVHWGPRPLDIDLLLYDAQIIHNDLLQIPHPRMSERHFVLQPLVDICPQLHHPQQGLSVLELLAQLPAAQGVTRLEETW